MATACASLLLIAVALADACTTGSCPSTAGNHLMQKAAVDTHKVTHNVEQTIQQQHVLYQATTQSESGVPNGECCDYDPNTNSGSCMFCNSGGWFANTFPCFLFGGFVCAHGPTSGTCLPHESCSQDKCCALGSSCNSCPEGHFEDLAECAWNGAARCSGGDTSGTCLP